MEHISTYVHACACACIHTYMHRQAGVGGGSQGHANHVGSFKLTGCRKPCWQIYAHGLHAYVGVHAQVAPLRKYRYCLSGATCARAPTYACSPCAQICLYIYIYIYIYMYVHMVSANMVSTLPRIVRC